MIDTARAARLLGELRSNTRRSPDALRALQGRLLRDAVHHAHSNVPFYRRFWAERGFDPDTVQRVEDVTRLPVVDARTAREAVRCGELASGRAADAARAVLHTSGSTAARLPIPIGAEETRLWRAQGLRIWREHGYRWHQKKAQFDPAPGAVSTLQRLGISRTAWIPSTDPLAAQCDRFVAARADWVIATPTVLRRLARALSSAGVQFRRPRGAFCAGELLDPHTRRLAQRVFGCDPVGVYALTEVGYVAWQCERRDGFHVNVDTHLVEVLRDGKPAAPGAPGQVVVTDLRNRTLPFLRYATGDLASWAEAPCGCGRQLPCLASLEGRCGTCVVAADGRAVSARDLVDHLSTAASPDAWRLVQRDDGAIELGLAPGVDRNAVVAQLRQRLGDVAVSVATLPPADETREKTHPITTREASGPGDRTPGRSAP